ncbi:MAG: hypothetical protein WCC27_00425 [Acidobacteriaceae bacterium]
MLSVFLAALALLLIGPAQHPAPPSDNPAPARKPVCSPAAVCFSGEASAGKSFRQAINSQLEFLFDPDDAGWTIEIVPLEPQPNCDEFAAVLTPPYRYHADLDIDMTYGISAEEEVADSPRRFSFVTNCGDYKIESDRLQIVLWPYSFSEQQVNKATAALGTSAHASGCLWIVASKISHAADTSENKLGAIEWMRFSVEIRLPNANKAPTSGIIGQERSCHF